MKRYGKFTYVMFALKQGMSEHVEAWFSATDLKFSNDRYEHTHQDRL
jgi:hypothetical protein